MKLPQALTPLAEPNFRLLWSGQVVSAAGDALMPVALAFAALQVSHSATALGTVLAVSTVARVVALPVGGVWADRLPRQLVMLSSDGVRAAAQGAIGALLLTGHLQLWALIAGALVFSSADGFFTPASSALIPQTVRPDRLQQANALMGLSRSVTYVAGPAASGILVAIFGPGWVFVIDSASFLVSMASLALLQIPRLAGAAQGSFIGQLVDGVRAVTSRRWYLINLLAHATWNFAIASFFVLGPIVARDRLGGASAWGLMSASLGAGGVLGGLLALRVRPTRPLLVANLMLIPAAFQLLALAIPLPVLAIMATCVAGWMGLAFLNELWFATVPQLMPAEVLARATSFDWLLSLIAMPIGFAVAGPLADHVGARTTLLVGAAIVAACALIVLVPGVRHVVRRPDGTIVIEHAAV